jgi:hypothetical protein
VRAFVERPGALSDNAGASCFGRFSVPRSILSLAFAAILVVAVAGIAETLPRAHAASAAAPAPVKPQKSAQIRGFSIQLSDSKGRDQYLKAVDDLADMGCTWINFVIAARQEDVKSEAIVYDYPNIPSDLDVEKILLHAKERGMNTMLMPIVLLNHSGPKDWRGAIEPPNWDNWFASYSDYILHMARRAKHCKVDIFCVGSELLTTEPFTAEWTDLIAQVRGVFNEAPAKPIKLTYSANWDHYDRARGGPGFWDKLDYIGMNNYHELADKPGSTVEQLDKRWEPIKRDILAFVDKKKMPFFFTEVGWHNLENTINQPWNYVAEGKIDLNEQLHAYQSFVETWSTVPSSKCMGAFIWEWRPGANGVTDHGTYSLQGTPALEVVKKWMQTR